MEHIETKRLILRSFAIEDAKAIFPLFCDDDAMRLAGMYPPLKSVNQSIERIEKWIQCGNRFAIVLKSSNEVIGYIAIKDDSEENREDTKELGYALISEFRRKGYMKEAISAVLSYLERKNIKYVWACCFKENKASEMLIRSMEFEFQQEGTYDSTNDKTYESLEFRITL